MELRQLKYFLMAQEKLSFTEAANVLNISQSTLSQQIKQLEIELDIQLFNRIGRQITLTEAGSEFVDFARQSVKKANDGALMSKDLQNLKKGTLRIGVSYGLKDFFLEALIDFAKSFPNISIKVEYTPSHDLHKKLIDFKADMILAYHEKAQEPQFVYKKLFSSKMVFVRAKDSETSKKESLSLKEICELPLVIATQNYNTEHIIYKIFKKHKLEPRFHIEVNDIPSTLDLVRTGHWNSIMVNTGTLEKDFTLITIKEENLTRHAHIISLKDTYETTAIKKFKEILIKKAQLL